MGESEGSEFEGKHGLAQHLDARHSAAHTFDDAEAVQDEPASQPDRRGRGPLAAHGRDRVLDGNVRGPRIRHLEAAVCQC